MANKLKFVKKVRPANSINNLQMLFEFVMGSDMVDTYDSEKTYSPRDLVIFYGEDVSRHIIYICKETTTGPFDSDKWAKISLKEYIKDKNLSLGNSDNITMISEEVPTAENNRVWMKPLLYKDLNVENIENDNMVVVFDGSQFSGQDDKPGKDDNIKVWFDYEFEYEPQ